uniref:Uncharacterized protein n=1 Tax=Anopheles maculatus TaxID=74869 RepID=A0A182T5E8_9DIPT
MVCQIGKIVCAFALINILTDPSSVSGNSLKDGFFQQLFDNLFHSESDSRHTNVIANHSDTDEAPAVPTESSDQVTEQDTNSTNIEPQRDSSPEARKDYDDVPEIQ